MEMPMVDMTADLKADWTVLCWGYHWGYLLVEKMAISLDRPKAPQKGTAMARSMDAR